MSDDQETFEAYRRKLDDYRLYTIVKRGVLACRQLRKPNGIQFYPVELSYLDDLQRKSSKRWWEFWK